MKAASLVRTASETEARPRATAKARERQGKILLVVGTIVAMLGVAVYSTTMLIADVHQEPVRFRVEGLSIIGIGLAVWLFGTFRYLKALMELGPRDDSF